MKNLIDQPTSHTKKQMKDILFHIFNDIGRLMGAKESIEITNYGQLHFDYSSKSFDQIKNIILTCSSLDLKPEKGIVSNPYPNNIDCSILDEFGIKNFCCLSSQNQMNINLNDILAWSEPVSVTYANSILGAKTNENPILVSLVSNILGVAHKVGYLEENNRKPRILIKVNVGKDVSAHLLGETIARICDGKVPYIFGLEKMLKYSNDEFSFAFIKDFCSGFSSVNQCRLFHINNVTPECKKYKNLIKTITECKFVDQAEIEKNRQEQEKPIISYKPHLCILGCPNLSMYQLINLTNEIGWELRQRRRKTLKIKTFFMTSSKILAKFKILPEFKELTKFGGAMMTSCPFNLNLNSQHIITNSTNLRCFKNAKCFDDQTLIKMICGGIR